MDSQEIGQENKSDTRRHQRLALEAELTVHSEGEIVPGRTLDISESDMSAVLAHQLRIGETVELKIRLPIGIATARAMVRSRNAFRHGFEFLQPLHDLVVHAAAADPCRSCGGIGLVVQTVKGGRGVAFMRIRCSDCNGTGCSKQ